MAGEKKSADWFYFILICWILKENNCSYNALKYIKFIYLQNKYSTISYENNIDMLHVTIRSYNLKSIN